MKKSLLAISLAALSLFAAAQTGVGDVATPDIEAERGRISADRASLMAGFLAEDAGCYQKFAVNNCLDRVNVRRREAMANLRRQEILLNDEERRVKGVVQLRKLDEKSSPQKQQDAEASRVKALEEDQSRLVREKQKSENQQKARSGEKAAEQASAERRKTNQQKKQARIDKQAGDADAAEKFDARQKEAQDRRVQHDSDRAKAAKPAAKSLPLPD